MTLRLAAWIVGCSAVVLVLVAIVVVVLRRRRSARAGGSEPAARVQPSAFQALGALAETRGRLAMLAVGERVDAVELLDYMVERGRVAGASDIHLTPTSDGVRASMRVDGLLYELATFRAEVRNALLIRIKVLAKLNVYKRDMPQDGRILVTGAVPIEIRVSVMPTVHGEKIVLRFMGRSALPYDIEQLGMAPDLLARCRELCRRPQGTIFVTGPTGSGKTTTMYACLAAARERRGGGVNIVTIEDPVEYVVPYLNQTQVNEAMGLTFAVGLRSLLRQDPNVIMVGEIRDRETAEIAMQAGLTGHLIFSTVHAENSAGVFTRLLNMGVEPFVLASASAAVVGQRLVRKTCRTCRTDAAIEPHQVEQLKRLGVDAAYLEGPYHRGAGCEACLGMGVAGRTGLFEMLEVDDAVRELLVKQVPTQQIQATAVRAGMRPLLVAGLDAARAGTLPLDEVLAAVGS